MNLQKLNFVFYYSDIVRVDEIPENMRKQTEDCYSELIEHVSNVDEILGEMFLQEKTPTPAELKSTKRKHLFADATGN
jgi:elongation factor G